MSVGVPLAFEDMRSYATLQKCFAQLAAQEGAGRVSRDTQVVAGRDIPHHVRVRIEHVGRDDEVVIVDEGRHLVAKQDQLGLQGIAD